MNLGDIMRIGIGYDVHKLVEGRPLILGGVDIPFKKGLLGHSDADVLLHAICDALLGAAGLGDLGGHFPDTDAAYKNADSCVLLAQVNDKIKEAGYAVNNIDTVLVAQAPKIGPYRDRIVKNICDALGLKATQVNFKATTEEGLGFTGTGEGMAAWAAVTLATR